MKPEVDSPDRWVLAAEALRQEVASLPFVAGLAETGLFQTRGRGRTVCGVMLRAQNGRVFARIGLSLDERSVFAKGTDRLMAEARQSLVKKWRSLKTGVPLQLDLVVMDLKATTELA